MKPIIEVKHLSKKYKLGETQPYYALRDAIADFVKNPFKVVKDSLQADEFWALDDLNFTINQGEVVGIVGRNGAGKSTLLKILSRITPPTEGEVILRGRVGSLLEVGTGFHQELTGRENIYLNGAILGMKRAEVKKKFDEIVQFAEVEKFLDNPLKHYSSGMYMRLAFAVAAHLEPEILIVDEVLAVGDAEFQKKCLGKMSQVAKEGRTVLFVSHNLITVQSLCENSILLEGGVLKQKGKTKDVIFTYTNDKSRVKADGKNKTVLHSDTPKDGVHFTDVKVTTSQGYDVIRSNDRLLFNLNYYSDYTEPISDARIVITVVSERSEQVVLRLDSDVAADTFKRMLSPSGKVQCKTAANNLAEGKYYAHIDFLIGGTSQDYIAKALMFEVETDLDSYGFKLYPDSSVCDHVIKYSFK